MHRHEPWRYHIPLCQYLCAPHRRWNTAQLSYMRSAHNRRVQPMVLKVCQYAIKYIFETGKWDEEAKYISHSRTHTHIRGETMHSISTRVKHTR